MRHSKYKYWHLGLVLGIVIPIYDFATKGEFDLGRIVAMLLLLIFFSSILDRLEHESGKRANSKPPDR